MLTSISMALLTIELASTPLERALCSLRALFTRTVPSSTILPSLVICHENANCTYARAIDLRLQIRLTSPILLRCLIVLGLERCSDKCSSVRLLYVARGLGIGGEVATWLVPFMYEITVTYPAEEACMMGPS